MTNATWFDHVTVLGDLPDKELAVHLRKLGDIETAEALEFELAKHGARAQSRNFFDAGRKIRRHLSWNRPAHVIGFVPPSSLAERSVEIRPNDQIDADRSLIGQRIRLGLDGFQPRHYPGGHTSSHGLRHHVLFHFSARQASPGIERLHFNVCRQVEQNAPFRYLAQPIFSGLLVDSSGLDLRYLTLPLTDPDDVALFGGTEPTARPALDAGLEQTTVDASQRAFDRAWTFVQPGAAVDAQRLGLDFSGADRSTPLRAGTYVVAQMPQSEQLVWEDGWDAWRLDLPTGQIVEHARRHLHFPFNYLLLTVDRDPAPTTTDSRRAIRRAPAVPTRGNGSNGASPLHGPGDHETPSPNRGADVKLFVDLDHSGPKPRLMYRLDSEHEELGLFAKPIEGPVLEQSPESFHAMLSREMDDLASGLAPGELPLASSEAEDLLRRRGQWLYRVLFDGEMSNEYQRLRERIGSLQIISSVPWIPWELIKPYDRDVSPRLDDDFFGMRYELTRWHAGATPAPSVLHIDRLAAFHAGQIGGSADDLTHADDEYAILARLAEMHPNVVDMSRQGTEANRPELEAALEAGQLDLLHVIAHGFFDVARPDHAAILLNDKRRLSCIDIEGPITSGIAASRPLIFFNACRAGESAVSLTGLGGWAQAFVRADCGAFLGPQWSIADAAALDFAESFYDEARRGRPLAAAVREARHQVRANGHSSLAALAPVVYANPVARLTFA